ncbi:MAG: hypothetical protein MUF73_11145 [Rhodobacteraceae bacterium]|jgi:hypothetical protein|nr:hypothetical protein [Paracoccaceae bacterium]
MSRRHPLVTILFALAALATPTLLALIWYNITGDPTFRPLSLSVERLVAFEADRGAGGAVVARVSLPPDSRMSEAALTADLQRGFAATGAQAVIRVERAPGPPTVVFEVGRSRLGPYPLSSAAAGLRTASDAWRMKTALQPPAE